MSRSALRGVLAIIVLVILPSVTAAQLIKAARGALGISPQSSWTCPTIQPIKGTFASDPSAPCVYHVPGARTYAKTRPERCYATETEAMRDWCRPPRP